MNAIKQASIQMRAEAASGEADQIVDRNWRRSEQAGDTRTLAVFDSELDVGGNDRGPAMGDTSRFSRRDKE